MLKFRQQALDEEFRPASTEKYLRLTSTSVYMVLATMLLLAAALVIWAVTGSVTDKVQMGGVANKVYLTAFADYKTLQELRPGQEVRMMPITLGRNNPEYISGRILSISRHQVSRQEELRKMNLLQFEQGVFPSSSVAYEVHIAVNNGQFLRRGVSSDTERSIVNDEQLFCNVQVITKRRSILQYLFEKLNE